MKVRDQRPIGLPRQLMHSLTHPPPNNRIRTSFALLLLLSESATATSFRFRMTFPHEFEPANSDNKARKERR